MIANRSPHLGGQAEACTYFCASLILGTARNLCMETWLMPSDASHVITIPIVMPQKEFLVKGLGSMLERSKRSKSAEH